MATLKALASPASLIVCGATACAAMAGCGDLQGFAGTPTPLVSMRVELQGELPPDASAMQRDPVLRAALVWGAQWLPEPLCILPPQSEDAASVIAAGCRDPFGFVPARVAANAAFGPERRATLELLQLPSADVLVGDLSARVAYGSIVVYDDRDGDGTLTQSQPESLRGSEDEDSAAEVTLSLDVVYGASFVSMTEPDTRLAYREGGFRADAAFYPRVGCGAPAPGFSMISAGGFSVASALQALGAGALPSEDPAQCRLTATDDPIAIRLRPASELRGIACGVDRTDGGTRYREPPAEAPDMQGRTSACTTVPRFEADSLSDRGMPNPARATDPVQWVVSEQSDADCVGLSHFVLRGCIDDPRCAVPDWDLNEHPPDWWPCMVQTP